MLAQDSTPRRQVGQPTPLPPPSPVHLGTSLPPGYLPGVSNLELFPPAPSPPGPIDRLLKVSRIYLEPEVEAYARGRDILARYPDAERVEVRSHWNIPGLFGNEGNVESWNRIKGTTLVLGVKKGMRFEANGRSADFLPPSAANGCTMACAYCYVPRHKGYANPITLFVNIEQLLGAIRRHAGRLGPKTEPNTVDPRYWVYDKIGRAHV